jgi:hypothetical protein
MEKAHEEQQANRDSRLLSPTQCAGASNFLTVVSWHARAVRERLPCRCSYRNRRFHFPITPGLIDGAALFPDRDCCPVRVCHEAAERLRIFVASILYSDGILSKDSFYGLDDAMGLVSGAMSKLIRWIVPVKGKGL